MKRALWKRIVSALLTVLLLLPGIPALAANDVVDSGYCGADEEGTSVSWTLTSDGTLIIDGEGAMKDFSIGGSDRPWNSYISGNNASIKKIIVEEGVTSIGNDAFGSYGSNSILSEVVLPEGLVRLGNNAFRTSPNLNKAKLPQSLKEIGDRAFYRCDLLNVELPYGLEKLGTEAFYHCLALTTVDIPETIESIGNNCFEDCSNIDKVIFRGEKIKLGAYIFLNCYLLKTAGPIGGDYSISFAWKDEIPSYAFEGCKNLISITIPETVTELGSYSFALCNSLRSVEIPSGVKKIGDGCFQECKSLKNIVIPKGITYLSGYQFKECTSLEYITFCASKFDCGYSVVRDCTKLTDVYFGGSADDWPKAFSSGNDAFKNATIHFGELLYPFSYQSTAGGVRTDNLYFNDNWFGDASSIYNHRLAAASLSAAMSGFDDVPYGSDGDANIRKLYKTLGFSNIKTYNYNAQDEDSIASAIGIMPLNDDGSETLVAIVLRGGGYGPGGWAGDFEVGNIGAEHEGFDNAANSALRCVKEYLKEAEKDGWKVDNGALKVWLTGYSRSAATADLLAQKLCRKGYVSVDHLFCYTFATPSSYMRRNGSSPEINAFNIVNRIDIVPQVPLSQWGFGKPGTTYYLPDPADASDSVRDAFMARFNELTDTDYLYYNYQQDCIEQILNVLSAGFDNRDTYKAYFQSEIMDVLWALDDEEAMKAAVDCLLEEVFAGVSGYDDFYTLIKGAKREIDDYKNGDGVHHIANAAVEISAAKNELQTALKNLLMDRSSDDPFYQVGEYLLGYLETTIGEFGVGGVHLGSGDIVVIGEGAEHIENAARHLAKAMEMVTYITDLLDGGKTSPALMQHWPEVYLAWMQTLDSSNLKEAKRYRVASVNCPVDVNVYDENGCLVAQTYTVEVTVTGENGESYTTRTALANPTDSGVEIGILGERRSFKLPEEGTYRFEIAANEYAGTDDTVSFGVDGFINDEWAELISYAPAPLGQGDSYQGIVTPCSEDITTCVFSGPDGELSPEKVWADRSAFSQVKLMTEEEGLRVSAQLNAAETATVLCAVYDANGALLTTEIVTAGESGEIALTLQSLSAAWSLKLLAVDDKWCPIGKSVELYIPI